MTYQKQNKNLELVQQKGHKGHASYLLFTGTCILGLGVFVRVKEE